MNVGAWLHGLGLEQYEPAFRDNDIDARVLPGLTAEDLREIGVTSVGHRRLLLQAIAALREPSVPVAGPITGPAGGLAAAAGAALPQAERRQLTVMFVDLVGSTALAARLDPEEMREVVRAYQNAVAGEVTRFEGYIAKYMGDGVLAYFGYPKAHEDAAERAVRAGLAVIAAVGRLAAPADGAPLATRVGVATGVVVVGDLIGEGTAREETVVGETPNLAARLQTLAEPGSVVIGPTTRRLVGGSFELADLGGHDLKGFAEPVRAWRVLGPGHAEGRFEARQQTAGVTPLVGREQELALLLDRWEQAKEGEGQVVLLQGEPGIGKSRLVRALRERLGGEPHTPLRFQCSPYHTTSPLHPVIEQLERAAGFQRADAAEAKLAKLEALLRRTGTDPAEAAPLLAPLLSIPSAERYPPLNLTPQRQRARTLEALLAQLAGLAARRPVLAILEDAHWSDPTTRELFDLTIERVRDLPALVVVTFRPEFQPPWTGHRHATALNLTRLSPRQGATMVERVAGDRTLPEDVAAQIVAKTDGVPLFLEELTKTVLDSGLLREEGARYELIGPLPPLAIPATLQDSLMARLDRLAHVKEVAQIGAAIGRVFSHRLLMAVARSTDGELREALNRLVGSELVFRQGRPPDAIYTFKHALVRDAAYESLLKSKRAELHACIAKALEERFPDAVEAEPELLAQHYTEAGLAQPAVDYWLRAGERAAQRSAHLEASVHLRKGLALLRALPDSPDRARREIELQTALGVSLLATRGFAAPEVGEAYARAEALCQQTGETSKLYPILQGLCFFHVVRAELNRARELAERCYAIAQRDADPVLLLAAQNALFQPLHSAGEFAAARHHLDRALQAKDPTPRRSQASLIGADVRVFVRGFGAHTVWHLGYAEQAVRLSEEAVALARDEGDPFSLGLALDYAAMLRQFGRDRQAAGELATAAVELCAEHHFAYYLAWAAIIQGWALAAAGQVEAGITRMRRGLADLEATGGRVRRPYYLGLLAEAQIDAGRPEEGLEILAEAMALAETTGERWRDADLQRTRGRLLLALARERATEAEACFRHALEIARKQNAKALELQTAMDLARVWLAQGRRSQARDLLVPVYGWFTEGFDMPDLKDARALLDGLR